VLARWWGVTDGLVESWQAGLEDLFARVAGRFCRREPRLRAFAYVRGLLAGLERRNGWTLAEHAGMGTPHGMQELLWSPCWDADAVRDDVRDYVIEQLGSPRAVLAADETGFIKKGIRSAGVQRQYSGTAGRTENCQIGVFLCYISEAGRALIDRELYLPRSWTEDRDRCRAAAIGDSVGFATKPEQARQMLQRAIAAQVPFSWFTADELYGQNPGLRGWLEDQDVSYVMATRRDEQVIAGRCAAVRRIDQVVAAQPARAWKRHSPADGAHGPRWYDWTATPIRREYGHGRGGWVLARRSLSDPTEIAYYLCYGPAGTRLATLARVAGSRWAIEEAFQTAKNEVGLDQYQVRRYDAWYAHITLAMTAAAFLAAMRARHPAKGAAPSAQTA
jgi:SRSO17 transposase